MILQALCEYYDRKVERGEIAPDGFIEKNIDFMILLDSDGTFQSIKDLREPAGKRMVGKRYNVPAIGKQAQKHANSGKDANLLWDNAAFVLGIGKKGDIKRNSFIETIKAYYPKPPLDVTAVLTFLENETMVAKVAADAVSSSVYGKEMESGAPICSFVVGDGHAILSESHVATAVAGERSAPQKAGVCLITGNVDVPLAQMHSVLKRIPGGQSSGCNLVSFNAPSFCSYGLEQSLNAPTGESSANAYAKALQCLIDSEKNRVRLAEATVVCWAQLADRSEVEEFEETFPGVFADSPKEDPDRGVRQVKGLLESIKSGKFTKASGDFYILGLSPNAARLSVRYWESGPVCFFAERIEQHFEDFKMVYPPGDLEYLSLSQILRHVAFEYKISNVPPNIAGDTVRSVLTGNSYPRTLFGLAIRRNRAEQKVTRARAAILKAFINREIRLGKKGYEEVMEIKMGLDKNNVDIGYRLGRLFAVLEKIQEDALGKLNAGIRDRFYGAASSTPVTVFFRLLQLKNHHVSKLSQEKPGLAVLRERAIGEIMDGIDDFPTHLTLEEQGRFAIGYYHQRQDLFTKQSDQSKENEEGSK